MGCGVLIITQGHDIRSLPAEGAAAVTIRGGPGRGGGGGAVGPFSPSPLLLLRVYKVSVGYSWPRPGKHTERLLNAAAGCLCTGTKVI